MRRTMPAAEMALSYELQIRGQGNRLALWPQGTVCLLSAIRSRFDSREKQVWIFVGKTQ